MDIIIKVDKYYIATRYPSYKKSVNITNKSIAVDIYKQVREVFEWLVRMLELKK